MVANLFIATIIGINSGLCFALLVSTFTAYLTFNNVALELLGFLSLRTIPYSFKFFWSPLVDSFHIGIFPKSFGQRKSWMISMQFCLIIAIILMGYIDINQHLYLACFVAFLTSILAATYDIAMDAFRIEFFKAKANLNSLVIIGFRLGFLLASALALYLSTLVEWKYVFLFVACCIIPCIFVVYHIKEDRQHKEVIYRNKEHWFRENMVAPFAILVKMPNFYIILLVILFYKMSDGYLSAMLIPFLVQVGFDRVDISLISETIGLGCFILGNVIGSYLSGTKRFLRTLFIAEFFAAATNLLFILLVRHQGNIDVYIFVTCIESACAGIANISLINYMSSLCKNQKYTSTHYALLISLTGLSRTIIASTSGILAVNYGWEVFFLVSASLSIPSLICIILLRYKQ